MLRLRDQQVAISIARKIRELAEEISRAKGIEEIGIMNFCGTHEYTTTRYGLRALMPPQVRLIAGPGCPVCITPGSYVDILIDLSLSGEFTVLTFGDALKLPGTRARLGGPRSLDEARNLGGSVRAVYSFVDAVRIAKSDPARKYVFFGIGFETTMPALTIPIWRGGLPANMYILSAFRFTPPIVRYLLEKHPEVNIRGIIAPGHVSAVIGSNSWKFIAEEYGVPTVVSGFEPIDVLLSIYEILKMIREGRAGLVNEYRRVVLPEGNALAKRSINEVLEVVDSYWRGIGFVERSGGVLNEKYRPHELAEALGIKISFGDDKLPGCICDKVVLGLSTPDKCPMFLRACTPQNPYGPCMVSYEGTCRIWAENLVPAVGGYGDKESGNT